MRRRPTLLLTLLSLTAGALLFSAPGLAAGGAPHRHARHVRPAKLRVGVEVLRFSGAGRQVTARGLVTAKLTDQNGHTTVVRDRIALTARTGGGCKVLHLFLDQLNLKLLGLTAHLDRVTLDITGRRGGGVLGSLFCRLSRAKAASASTVRALNAAVRHHRGQAVRFTASITPKATASATGSCQVLDLIVGPLNLDLLGLVVDLKKVHLSIIAQRGQGKLGDIFCDAADNNTSGTPPPAP